METFLLKGDIIPSKICEYRISFIYGNYITLNYNPLCRLALTFIYISLCSFSDNY